MQKIEYVDINKLSPHPENPRLIKDEKFKKLCESIAKNKDYFETRPILCNPNMVIFAGNMRFNAARSLGWPSVPVAVMDIPEERQKELMLRDNVSNGEWDWDVLANGWDVETLLDIGFEKNDLSIFDIQEDDFEDDKDDTDVNHTKIKLGDVFVLGDHRIMCGDSTSGDDVKKLMNGQQARMFFTDPPYGVNYVSGGARGQKGQKHEKIKNDDLSGDKLKDFLKACFFNGFNATTKDATIYSWFANSTHKEFRTAMEEAGWRYSHILIWIKSHFVLSHGDYHHAYDPCMYGWKDDEKHYSNPRMRSFDDITLLDKETFSDQIDAWFVERDNLSTYKHPTQKPVRLSERALKMSTQTGDGVLDLFTGSGGVLIACEQSNRNFFGMELDQKYVASILNRWADFTGKDPIRESDGALWSVIKSTK